MMQDYLWLCFPALDFVENSADQEISIWNLLFWDLFIAKGDGRIVSLHIFPSLQAPYVSQHISVCVF